MAKAHKWVIGYLDEVWWSRFALPHVRMWRDPDHPARLHEQVVVAGDPDPQALACYGLWCEPAREMLLRFVTGRPVSQVTTAFLEWVSTELAAAGHKVLVLIWDNASWHVSKEVRSWIAAANATAKRSGVGIRILVVGLPTKSPWLNNIEVQWQHSKAAIVELERVLTAEEVEARVGAYFETGPHPRLIQPGKEPAEREAPAAAPTEKTTRSRGKGAQAVKAQQAA